MFTDDENLGKFLIVIFYKTQPTNLNPGPKCLVSVLRRIKLGSYSLTKK